MSAHSAIQASFTTTPSYRILNFCKPRDDLAAFPTESEQKNFKLVDAEREARDGSLLQQTEKLPPINSILHEGNTSAAPTQQAAPSSAQRMPWLFHHAIISPAWGSRTLPVGYAGRAQAPLWNATPSIGKLLPDAEADPYSSLCYGLRGEIPTRHRRIEHSPVVLYTSSAIGKSGSLPARVLKCRYVNPLTCQPCSSVFSRPDCLLRHERTVHSPKRPKWECQLCGEDRRFTRYDSLARHMRNIHLVLDFPGKQR